MMGHLRMGGYVTEVELANKLASDIDAYCEESHQRLRGDAHVTTYTGDAYDDDGDDDRELKRLPF